MILTGPEIAECVGRGSIVVEPYDSTCLEPNSYGFHLGEEVVEYTEPVIDVRNPNLEYIRHTIPEEGLVLLPDRFYLGHTLERIGGVEYAAELYCNVSTAMCGMFLQTSAPLGHTGAVIKWTLEILVAQPLIVYPRMRIGKICFWRNFGNLTAYDGRYLGSTTAIASRINED